MPNMYQGPLRRLVKRFYLPVGGGLRCSSSSRTEIVATLVAESDMA